MCGICASISFDNENKNDHDVALQASFVELSARLKRRGPDNFKEVSAVHNDAIKLFFCSSVLHLRGSFKTVQPFEDNAKNILLWNGEIFGGPLAESGDKSDTIVLAEKLSRCKTVIEVLDIIKSVEGPFAFIFYQVNGLLWFGRDIFGRRSLLWNSENSSFQLCSVAFGMRKWNEVPTEGIFCLDLNLSYSTKSFAVSKYAWSLTASGNQLPQRSCELINMDLLFKTETEFSVCNAISRPLNRCLPADEIMTDFLIPLTNVNKGIKYSEHELLSKIFSISVFRKTVSDFETALANAVKKRVQNQLNVCKNCYRLQTRGSSTVKCDHCSVGVLFSGGLDSIVIACLSDRYVSENKPIDLINVAFASTSKLKGSNSHKGNLAFETPDRLTGKNGVLALRRICPSRNWNFIEVNISEEDLVIKRKANICDLLNPSCTVLDDSIGCALWFAARSEGFVESSEGYYNYESPARVLLVGMGADEQLAGYARHRAKFSAAGWCGLIEELSMELDRIGSRNLGRDDRIIADSGVESRYPFLDENVVAHLNSLPVWLKANLNYPRGIGEKLLLRLLALKLGLTEAAVLPKRAIQFGSRIARIENSREKGSDVCERLKGVHC